MTILYSCFICIQKYLLSYIDQISYPTKNEINFEKTKMVKLYFTHISNLIRTFFWTRNSKVDLL